MVMALRVWYVYQILYLLTLFFVKISILAFYCRISPSRVHMPIKITGVIVTIYTVAMIFVNVSFGSDGPMNNTDTDTLSSGKAFECPRKPSLAWSPTAFPKECNNLVPVYYAQAGFNIVSDIVILLLPVPLLLKLQVSRSNKSMTSV